MDASPQSTGALNRLASVCVEERTLLAVYVQTVTLLSLSLVISRMFGVGCDLRPLFT